VKGVDAYASQIVGSFLQNFWHRLKDGGSHTESNPHKLSLWDLICACELSDPTAFVEGWMPEERTWLAVRKICDTFEIVSDDVEFAQCKAQILKARDLCFGASRIISAEQETLARRNLLAFFCEVYGEQYGGLDGVNAGKGEEQWKQLPLFATFAKACFSIMMSSAIVEALFSRYGYARSKYRSAMKDGTVANILRTHEIEDLVSDVRVPFSRLYNLRLDALSDRIDWSR
jgi:hypothetical protein